MILVITTIENDKIEYIYLGAMSNQSAPTLLVRSAFGLGSAPRVLDV